MISYRSFTKRFGRQRAVDSLTLDVRPGEVVALLGPNGSGKTTTLKAAAGLIVPSSGEVMLGDPPRPAACPDARRALSYLPQRVSFPDALTASEVIAFYGELRGVPPERGREVLRFASLDGERTIGTYSGGMVQRLGLAVAMLPDAPLFLLDEPTASLDPDGLCAFYGVVERARKEGRAVLFSSHQLGDAERLADAFAVLVEGRLVAHPTASELKDRLAARGVMRLRLSAVPESLLAAVRVLAPAARLAGEELIVPAPAALRPRVLEAVRAVGVEVRGLTAEEGRLDVLYGELVADAGARRGNGGGEP